MWSKVRANCLRSFARSCWRSRINSHWPSCTDIAVVNELQFKFGVLLPRRAQVSWLDALLEFLHATLLGAV
jgi:hypothetical protein